MHHSETTMNYVSCDTSSDTPNSGKNLDTNINSEETSSDRKLNTFYLKNMVQNGTAETSKRWMKVKEKNLSLLKELRHRPEFLLRNKKCCIATIFGYKKDIGIFDIKSSKMLWHVKFVVVRQNTSVRF